MAYTVISLDTIVNFKVTNFELHGGIADKVSSPGSKLPEVKWSDKNISDIIWASLMLTASHSMKL